MGNWFSDLGDSLSTFFTDLFTNLGTFFGNLWTNLSGAFTTLGTNLGNFFGNLWTNVSGAFTSLWTNLGNSFQSIFTWFGDFFEGLRLLFVRIFVPADNFFTNKINETKATVSEKIPYDDYVSIFEDIEEVGSTPTRSSNDNVSMSGYQIGEMTFNMPNFIDLSFITQFKNTWYSWVRAFTFIALIIYNVNQVIKLLRGYNVADGVAQATNSLSNSSNTNSGGGNK